jgi:hypothetical protein
MIVGKGMEGIWKEAAVAYNKVLFRPVRKISVHFVRVEMDFYFCEETPCSLGENP